jgi:hypothetical protein
VNWEAISAIGQIVGALAVVISLIYVAREIRSNARAARLASMDNANRWLREVTEHPHLGELYYRGMHDFESLQNGDLIRFSLLMLQLFIIHQETYYQQLEGHLDPRTAIGGNVYGQTYGSSYATTNAWGTSVPLFLGKASVLIIKFK